MLVNNNSAKAFQALNKTSDSQGARLTNGQLSESQKNRLKPRKREEVGFHWSTAPVLNSDKSKSESCFNTEQAVSIARLNIEISMLYSWSLMEILSNQPSTLMGMITFSTLWRWSLLAHHGDDNLQPILEMITISPSWRWSLLAHHGDDHQRPVVEMITIDARRWSPSHIE